MKIKTYDEIQPAPMKVLSRKTTDDEKLVLYLQGELDRTKLSKDMEKQLQQMQECAELIRRYGSKLKVVKFMQSSMDISQATAYRLFDKTQRIFGVVTNHDQRFWVDLLLDGLMKDIRKAQKKKDYRSVASLRKIMKETIKELMGSGDAQLYERIQPQQRVIGFFPEELKTDIPTDPRDLEKLLRKFKQTRKKKQYEEDAEDIDHEELS